MSEITCRCHYCYRVHRLPATQKGYVLSCSCGQVFRVPEDAAPAEAPSDRIPLAAPVDPGETPAGGAPSAASAASPSGAGPGVEGGEEEESEEERPAAPGGASPGEHPGAGRPGPAAREGAGAAFDPSKAGGPAPAEPPAPSASSPSSPAEPSPPEVRSSYASSPGEGAPLQGGADAPAVASGGEPPGTQTARSPTDTSGSVASVPPDPVPAARAGEPERPAALDRSAREGARTMGTGHLLVSVILFVLWVLHASPWIWFTGGAPLPSSLGLVEHTHYLGLERAFWNTALFGLALACLGEALRRRLSTGEEEDWGDELAAEPEGGEPSFDEAL